MFACCCCFISSVSTQQTASTCYPASRARVEAFAQNGTLLVTAVDRQLWDFFGASWVASVESSGITYWLVAAMGEDAAAAVGAAGHGHRCVLTPQPANVSALPGPVRRRRRQAGGSRGSGGSGGQSLYEWRGDLWKAATWAKVAAVAGLVELGFSVVHSDVDVSWFRDPVPLFLSLAAPPPPEAAAAAAVADAQTGGVAPGAGPTALFSTDLLTTLNPPNGGEDSGMERSCDPSYSLNTGVYWVSGSEQGLRLMRGWLAIRDASFPGDDQQGLNLLVRGNMLPLGIVTLPLGYDVQAATATIAAAPFESAGKQRPLRGSHEAKRLGAPLLQQSGSAALRHTYLAAGAPGVPGAEAEGVVVSCLPVSSFSHTYAFATSRLHQVRQHPLYEVHWVWGGKSLESKRQCMRDAMAFVDPPHHYDPQRIITFELQHVEMPPGYNQWPASRSGDMVAFALSALSSQLQQAYWALALAMALNRTLVLPQFQCYCAKNWFATTACRITSERDTVFPFPCPLSHVFRAKLLTRGELRVPDPRPHPSLASAATAAAAATGDAGSGGGGGWFRVADVREVSFLRNPRTAGDLRSATPTVLRVVDQSENPSAGGSSSSSGSRRRSTKDNDALGSMRNSGSDNSDNGSSSSSSGTEILLDSARTDRELQDLLLSPPYDAVRVLHVPRPATVLSGFADALMWQQYDHAVQRVTATWCCRSQRDAEAHFGGSRREKLQPLPPSRQQLQHQQHHADGHLGSSSSSSSDGDEQ
ncbi:hypothetical protein PLESTB_001574400 [Pleodorina starrii]|uniref:Nucleotide-diphospho-sugar transferase domain-containing protein n=1 Tax=Pleodorina starrii TaxID=330485 RepID=A0A9W6F8C1_9CHLO|nr:hypothetical protein PLESTB_001574400 [Pleodorina starrii]